MFTGWFKKNENFFYAVFRIVFGAFFLLHGLGKIGLMGKDALAGLMLVVGIGETLVGLGILFGFLTRIAALGGIVIMVGAFVKAHLPKNWNPTSGGGELALLYLFAFIVILAFGYRKWGIDGFLKKEVF